MSSQHLQEYFVPARSGEAALVEKRSRFVARVWPVACEPEALEQIAACRALHPGAAHNVYAYRFRNGTERSSDDGEPQGSSGAPVLHVFRSEGMFNFCCVVTRYYGGVLLGAKGLVRIYSRAAKAALDVAGRRRVRPWNVLRFACSYELFGPLQSLAARCRAVELATRFEDVVFMELRVPPETTAALLHGIQEASAGAIVPEMAGSADFTDPPA